MMEKENFDPVFILIRTSKRPKFFNICMESVKNQTYPNIITIVHSDDPKDEYIEGDIIINGERIKKRHPGMTDPELQGGLIGNGPYNLYNNRLLNAIPKDAKGWYHFIDDDDKYYASDVIEKLVNSAKRDSINVARVQRWGNVIFPKNWKRQRSYQTECFFLHTDHKDAARWWSKTGGDHYYSGQLTKKLHINWIEDLIICKAQEGKGRGMRYDRGENPGNPKSVKRKDLTKLVWVLFIKRVKFPAECRGREGEIKQIVNRRAIELEMRDKVIINPSKAEIEEKKNELIKKTGKIIKFVIPDENIICEKES